MKTNLYYQNFVSARVFDAICTTTQGDYPIALEFRTKNTGKMEIFTMIDKHPIRSASLQELVLSDQKILSLAISHRVPITWSGEIICTTLTEIYAPTNEASYPVSIQVKLTVREDVYETEPCISLSEALQELGELIDKGKDWSIRTCFGCAFSYPVDKGPGWDDRDGLRCLRDASPEMIEAFRHNPNAIPTEMYLTTGHCFFHAFHYCSAWKPFKL